MIFFHKKPFFALCLIICFIKQIYSTPLTEKEKIALERHNDLKIEIITELHNKEKEGIKKLQKVNPALYEKTLEEILDRSTRFLYRDYGIVPKPDDHISADDLANKKAEDDAYMAKREEIVDRRLRIRLRQSGIPIAGDNEELIAEDNKNENKTLSSIITKILSLLIDDAV